jgi:SRSO17 transposase
MSEDRQERFAAYVEALAEVIGHADRAAPLRDYCLGLLLPGDRKSVEPIAAVMAPARVSAKHQSLLHFVANAAWSNERVLRRIQELTLPIIEGSGAIEAWIIDDTGFPKNGRHSVGVARQYCGQLGKQDNCQVAVSLSLANHAASLPIAWRLYLPLEWTADAERRAAAGIPETVGFLTKPEIALEQIQAACAAARGCADGCRVRHQHPAARGDRRSGTGLCRRHPAAKFGVAAGDGTAAAAALVGSRPSPEADAPRHRAPSS